jgi:CRP/FNR family transcriptional regulator
MADYLGLTLETVSRQMSRLKAKRVIELPTNRDVIIPDLELLSALGHIDPCVDKTRIP